MANDRAALASRVLDEFDTLFGWRPEEDDLATTKIEQEDQEEAYAAAFYANVCESFGVDEDVVEWPNELGPFIDALNKHWHGETLED